MHGALLPAWLHAAKVRANKGTRKIVSNNNGVFVVKFIIILSLYYYLWEDKVADKDVIGKILIIRNFHGIPQFYYAFNDIVNIILELQYSIS